MAKSVEATSGLTLKRLVQCTRIAISIASMGFIYPHAIADGLDGDQAAPKPRKK